MVREEDEGMTDDDDDGKDGENAKCCFVRCRRRIFGAFRTRCGPRPPIEWPLSIMSAGRWPGGNGESDASHVSSML